MTYGQLLHKKTIVAVLGFLMSILIITSVGAQIQIQNEAMEVLNTEVVVMQVGTDANVQLAVDTFLAYYPNPKGVKVVSIETQKELFSWIIDFPNAEHLLFGHGTEDGLGLKNSIIDWIILKNYVDNQQNEIFVMACYSGLCGDSEKYSGIPFEIDAEAAALISVLTFSEDKVLENKDTISSLIPLRQLENKHPLNIQVDKKFKTERKAMWACWVDRMAIHTYTGVVMFLSSTAGTSTMPSTLGNAVFYVEMGNFWHGQYYFCNDIISAGTQMVMVWYIVTSNDYIDPYDENANKGSKNLVIEGTNERIDVIIKQTIKYEQEIVSAINVLETDPSKYVEVASEIDRLAALYAEREAAELRKNTYLTFLGLAAVTVVPIIVCSPTIGASLALGLPAIAKWQIKKELFFKPIIGLLFGLVISKIVNVDPVYATAFVDDYKADNDSDDIPNGVEKLMNTDPNDDDSDNDGFEDGWEVANRFNPLDYNSPSRAMWKNSDFANGSTIASFDIKGVDRVLVYDKHWTSSEQLWDTHNVTLNETFSDSIFAWDFFQNTLEWTRWRFVFQRQNNTAGTEWVNLYEKYFFMHDNYATPTDSDTDGLPDYFEDELGCSDKNDADSDNDGLTDYAEIFDYASSPELNDTDGDGILDDDEIIGNTHSFPDENYREYWDVDGDGFANWVDFDADNDGLNDSYEDTNKDGDYTSATDLSDYLDNDTDNDGLIDGLEVLYAQTSPEDSDHDNDGFPDGFECFNHMNPRITEADDWIGVFADDFSFNSNDQWTDISTYGEMRRGGLATTTVYNDYEANEDFVVRVYNNSGDWSVHSTANPQITQYSSSETIYGFTVTWDLSSLRSDNPAEAIESADLDLDYYSNTDWDTDDDINIALVNLYCNGSIINDSSTTAHANYSMWQAFITEITNQDVNIGSTSTIDIVDLVDYWYQCFNESKLSLFFYPDPENAIGGTYESIVFDQGSFDPRVTIKTGDSVLRASSYGSALYQWHGPQIYHNFGTEIDDFEFYFNPYLEADTTENGLMKIVFYSGVDGTGTAVFTIQWTDYSTSDSAYLKFMDGNTTIWENNGATYANWFTPESDNSTFTRNGSTITVLVDGDEKDDDPCSTTIIQSMTISLEQYSTTGIVPKLGIRGLIFKGHSDDYDDDGLNTTEEQSEETLVWVSDTDNDGLTDGDEVNVRGTDPLDWDSDGDFFNDGYEVQKGTNPLSTGSAPLMVSYVYGGGQVKIWIRQGTQDSIGMVKVWHKTVAVEGWPPRQYWGEYETTGAGTDTTANTVYNGEDCFYLSESETTLDGIRFKIEIYDEELNFEYTWYSSVLMPT